MKRNHIETALRAHTNLSIFAQVESILEGLYGGSPTANKSAQRIIDICKQEQTRQLRRMDAAIESIEGKFK